MKKDFEPHGDQFSWLCSGANKRPVSPKTGSSKDWQKAENWVTLEEAQAFCEGKKGYTPAVVVGPHPELICIDIDGVVDEKGNIVPFAKEIIEQINSYTEISSSGRGVHILAYGTKSTSVCKTTLEGKSVEVYGPGDRPKPIKISRRVLKPYTSITSSQEGLGWFCNKHALGVEQTGSRRILALSPEMSDKEAKERLRNAKNSKKFCRLFDEGEQGGDHSAADLALVSMIAFFTQDPEQIDKIFRQSKLFREKKWGRADYRKSTIDKALEGLTETFQKGGHNTTRVFDIDEGTVPEEDFPTQVLPEVMRDAAMAISRANGGDDSITKIVSTAVQALFALAIQKKVCVCEIEECGLEHYLSFFHTIVGHSATARKTSSVKPLTGVFDRYHEKEEKEYLLAQSTHRNAEALLRAKRKEADKTNKSLEEKARAIAKDEMKIKELEPKYYRLFATDVNGASFFMRLGQREGCYSIFSTDGGDFLDYVMGDFRTGVNDTPFIKLITRDNIHIDRVGTDRKGYGIDIPDPCGNIFVMTQEERWDRFNKHPKLKSSGLLGRNNPVILPPREKGYTDERSNNRSIKGEIERWDKMVEAILNYTGTIKLKLSKEAEQGRGAWYREIQCNIGVGQAFGDVSDILSRAVSEAVKRAALFHVADHHKKLSKIPKEIPELTFMRAVAAQKFYSQQAINARRSVVGKAEKAHIMKNLEKWVKATKSRPEFADFVPLRRLRQFFNISDQETAEKFIEELEEFELIETQVPMGRVRKPRYKLMKAKAKAFLKKGLS